MPEKSGKNLEQNSELQQKKRNLIDSIESLRESRPVNTGTIAPLKEEINTGEDKVIMLEKELKLSRATVAMLENDLRRMEQKALEAIAENGKLKQQLDLQNEQVSGSSCQISYEQQDLLDQLHQSRNDHFMLTQALIDSENEIGRLTRALEKITRKFIAA